MLKPPTHAVSNVSGAVKILNAKNIVSKLLSEPGASNNMTDMMDINETGIRAIP